MMNSPWAMLMTPATPKMTASPSAAMIRIATRLKPLKNCVRTASAMSGRAQPMSMHSCRWVPGRPERIEAPRHPVLIECQISIVPERSLSPDLMRSITRGSVKSQSLSG